MPTGGFSIKPLKVKLLAGEQKATQSLCLHLPGRWQVLQKSLPWAGPTGGRGAKGQAGGCEMSQAALASYVGLRHEAMTQDVAGHSTLLVVGLTVNKNGASITGAQLLL